MSVFERCLEKCRARKGAVVYSDGEDRRVVSAAAKLIREGLVEPILIGDPEKVRAALQESGETGVSLQVVNPYNPALLQHNAAEYMSIQKDKGKDISEEEAIKAVKNPLAAGALMVRRGEAEIGVAGNLSSTADVIRAGLRMVGTAAGSKTVSSFFFMLKDNNVCMFTDCAVIPEPTSAQLADIAISTAGGRGSPPHTTTSPPRRRPLSSRVWQQPAHSFPHCRHLPPRRGDNRGDRTPFFEGRCGCAQLRQRGI